LLLFNASLVSLDIDTLHTNDDLLPHCEIYIDLNKSTTIDNIKGKRFKSNKKQTIGFGYSPDFDVWLRFSLTNKSQNTIHKIIEYNNPLTSSLSFFENGTLLYKDGLLHLDKKKESLHPIFKISLKAKESKIFYIKASSKITTLIININIFDTVAFYKQEMRDQFELALFFGAMSLIIIYNFIIYLATRELSYLYYVLSFIGIGFHHLIYKGVASLYFFSSQSMVYLVNFSSFIVAFPVFFLALFTKTVLNLKQYPLLNRILNTYLVLFPILVFYVYYFDFNKYRSLFSVALLFILFIISLFALWKRNPQAKFIVVGWVAFFTSALFMFLSSKGIYTIYAYFPNYTEFSLIFEAIAFSLLLANYLKRLQKKELKAKEALIAHQKEEKVKLTQLVSEKTSDLKKTLDEKKLLLKELNHRVKNSMQTIISFVQLEKEQLHNKNNKNLLENLENRIFAINNLYALLHTSENISTVNAHKYISLIVNNVQKCFQKDHITTTLNTIVDIKSDDAVYCGFILNEALTNCYQHAFTDSEAGEVIIELTKKNELYSLLIKDTGAGITNQIQNNTLGMLIINTLATTQLGGTIDIDISNGVSITIEWRHDE
jgi:two-component sensor histidine kinase